jgi:2-oxoisovalerate dehydrogenase E1 component
MELQRRCIELTKEQALIASRHDVNPLQRAARQVLCLQGDPGEITYIGEEAVSVGVCAHLRIDDAVFSTHRGHGHAIAKGMKPERLIAEVLGKATGCCQGRGGSMHLFEPEVGFYGTSGIVAPSILLASGAAYKFKLEGSDRVGVAFFGDGASNNGAFHEGLNMAAAWQLPVLFV